MMETFLSIASFAISLGGLVSLFAFRDRRKEIILTTVISALAITSTAALYSHYSHEQILDKVQAEILEKLSTETLTFEELYQDLPYRPYSTINEALFRGLEAGTIGHRVIEFSREGRMLAVRGYYVL